MVEEIRTGGTKKFISNDRPELDEDLAKKIDEGYKKAEVRKKKEKRIRIIKLSIGAILILLILGGLIFLL